MMCCWGFEQICEKRFGLFVLAVYREPKLHQNPISQALYLRGLIAANHHWRNSKPCSFKFRNFVSAVVLLFC